MDEEQYPKPGVLFTHSRSGSTYESLGRGKLKHAGVWYDAVFYVNEQGEQFARTTDDFDANFSEFGK